MRRRTKTTLWALTQCFAACILTFVIVIVSGCGTRKDGVHTLYVLQTGDVHGSYFDSTYVSDQIVPSLVSIKWYIDSVKEACGDENVLVIDAGDALQGNNASHYFNYVDTLSPHLFPRMAKEAGYDIMTVGNHDIETGHGVYDRIVAQYKGLGMSWLAGNAIDTKTGKPYFKEYEIIKKAGLKVLVLGYTNANIKAWLDESLWKGMTFESLIPFVQERVDRISAKENPDVVIVVAHSGTGKGDGSELENQSMDLFKSLRGVDLVIAAHDHKPLAQANDSIAFLNGGSHAKNLGFGVVSVDIQKGKVISKKCEASIIPVNPANADSVFRAEYRDEYLKIREFTCKEIGDLSVDLVTREAYKGQCNYINLVHKVQMEASGAQVSFAAPLTFDGVIKAGKILYNDLFKIYPYENQLFVMNMTGKQIVDYLEYSYALWIKDYNGKHILNIHNAPDARTGVVGWSFVSRYYNFDSAAGLIYTVDCKLPKGQRVKVVSMADGSEFNLDANYTVALTSYRAAGGGNTITEGAGISKEELESHIVAKLPEIRELVYAFIQRHGTLDEVLLGDQTKIGHWNFIPQPESDKIIEKDLKLIFEK